jgi:hypothetical protein
MAKDKKSILVYADWISIFEKLEDIEAGVLIKHFFRYVNDINPIAPDRLTDIIFEPIKQQLKRDLKRYEAICLRNRGNGEKGGRPKQNPKKPKKPSGLITNPNNPDEPDTDTDTDTDNDNDTVKEKKYNNIPPLIDEVLIRIKERKLSVDAEAFMAHYISNGWKVSGRAAMKDWDAALTTWEKNNKKFNNNGTDKRNYQEAAKHPNQQW